MKIIKDDLKVGQRITCQMAGINVYTAIVRYISFNPDTQRQEASVEREDDKEGEGLDSLWYVQRNYSGSWDGCVVKNTRGWYSSNRQHNRYSGGSWLYSNRINNWKSMFPE